MTSQISWGKKTKKTRTCTFPTSREMTLNKKGGRMKQKAQSKLMKMNPSIAVMTINLSEQNSTESF